MFASGSTSHVLRCDRSRGIVVEPPGARVEESRAVFWLGGPIESGNAQNVSRFHAFTPSEGRRPRAPTENPRPAPNDTPSATRSSATRWRDDGLLPAPRAGLDHGLISLGCSGTTRDAEESSARREQCLIRLARRIPRGSWTSHLRQRGAEAPVSLRAASGQERKQREPVLPLLEIESATSTAARPAAPGPACGIGVGDERRTVEGKGVFGADPVDGNHERAVGDPVGRG